MNRLTAPERPTSKTSSLVAPLGPRQQLRAGRLPRRLVQLYVGVVLYGISMAMMIRSTLGLDPWDVLHSGISGRVPLTFGQVVIVVGVVVLLGWIPLHQWPGFGTVSNAVTIGVVTDVALGLLTTPSSWWLRGGLLLGGIALNAVATAGYVGAGLGAGPRDGLMTGLVARTGWSVRVVRTSIEVSVLTTGWLLGGVVGVGTVAYALAIGPLVHLLLPRLEVTGLRDVTPVQPGLA